jgi:outer membrane immunogenic protein
LVPIRVSPEIFGEVSMRVLLGAAFSVVIAGTAFAADMPVRNYYTAPATFSPSSWAGPYLGGQFGYEWGSVSNNPTRPNGFQGGVEAGYNWQFGQFVVGGETDLNSSGARDTSAPFQFTNPWYGTVRGRAGIAFNNILLYGTAGLGFGELTGQSFGFLSQSKTSAGFVGGAGIEYGFASHWSAKAEWLYLDLADRTFPATGANNGLSANLLRFGVNYHF